MIKINPKNLATNAYFSKNELLIKRVKMKKIMINMILKHQQLSLKNLEKSFFSKIESRIIKNNVERVKDIRNTADYPKQYKLFPPGQWMKYYHWLRDSGILFIIKIVVYMHKNKIEI
jgi:hypothetical protein